jgi:NitT/TauT family transport system ATP-binding protein
MLLDLEIPFSRPRPFEIEETQEFGGYCRTLRLTIEQGHAHSDSSCAKVSFAEGAS